MAKKKKQSEKQQRMAEERHAQRKIAAKKERKKRRRKKIMLSVVCFAAAAAIIAGISIWAIKTSPQMHLLHVEKTDHYSLNAAEVSFYSWQIYQQYISTATDSSAVPNTNTPLSEQDYDEETTWEDFFVDAGCDYAQRILMLCEAAYMDGYEPDEDITEEAENSYLSFDTSSFPDGVKKDDAVHAMELYFLAVSFSEYIEDQVVVTDEDLEAYYTENAQSMQTCSYICFGFSFDDSDDSYMTSDTVEEEARELRRCTTKSEFEEWVTDYYKETYTSLSDEDIAEYIASLYSENVSYIDGDSISEWAFSGDIKAGESTIITDEDAGTMIVCLLLSEPVRDETYPVNLRQILFTTDTYGSEEDAMSAAESVLEQWESGEQTEDNFAAYADYYSEDTSADGGLYSAVSGGQMLSSWKEWFFDESRQAGDVTILESSYGVCIVYYVGLEETPSWELTASEAITEEKYNTLYDTYTAQVEVKQTDMFTNLVRVINL